MGATAGLAIQAGLGALKTASDVWKTISELIKKPTIDAGEVSTQLNLLHQYLFDAQRGLHDADNELNELKQQLDRRKDLEADKHWEAEGGFYRRQSEVKQGIFKPYCPICWHASDNTIPMAECQTPGTYKCGLHGPLYWTKRPATSGKG
jgi:hypothetical protein